MVAFVVDANAIHVFQKERISGSPAIGHSAIKKILDSDVIALDRQQLCHQEWLDCAAGTYPFALSDWIAFQIGNGKIELHDLAPNNCRKRLTEVGLPQRDHKWVRLAIGCGGLRLVTEDIDFFDPKLKKASATAKEKAKKEQSGSCCKALKDEFSVIVMCLSHVDQEVQHIKENGGSIDNKMGSISEPT